MSAAQSPLPRVGREEAITNYIATVTERLQNAGFEYTVEASQRVRALKVVPVGTMHFYQVSRGTTKQFIPPGTTPEEFLKDLGKGGIPVLLGCLFVYLRFDGFWDYLAGIVIALMALLVLFAFVYKAEYFYCLFPADDLDMSGFRAACELSAEYAVSHQITKKDLICVPVGVVTRSNPMNDKASVAKAPREMKIGRLGKRTSVNLLPAIIDLSTGEEILTDKDTVSAFLTPTHLIASSQVAAPMMAETRF